MTPVPIHADLYNIQMVVFIVFRPLGPDLNHHQDDSAVVTVIRKKPEFITPEVIHLM